MAQVNVWAYKTPDFRGSPQAPMCSDGNAGTVRTGEIEWNLTMGFAHLEDLVQQMDTRYPSGGEDSVDTLGILCHGAPGRLAILERDDQTFNTSTLSTHAPRFQTLNEIIHRNRRARRTVIFLSCAFAEGRLGTEVLTNLSSWMDNTVLVGFTSILTTDAIELRHLSGDAVCLPPDVRETTETYDEEQDIRAQMSGNWTQEQARGFPFASPNSPHARRFLNGSEMRRARTGGERTGTRRSRR